MRATESNPPAARGPRRAIVPLAIAAVVVAGGAVAQFGRVDTYASGDARVTVEGLVVGRAPAAASVVDVFVKPGQQVVPGTPLVRLCVVDAASSGDIHRAAGSRSDIEHRRRPSLFCKPRVGVQECARECTLSASGTGVVISLPDSGKSVAPETDLVTMSDEDTHYHVVATLPASHLDRVQPGAPLRFEANGIATRDLTIESVQRDEAAGTLLVHADIGAVPQAEGLGYREGQTGVARVKTGRERIVDALLGRRR